MISAYESPSNIALVKYWGKYGDQLPRNPSISFTLSEALTKTSVTAQPKTGNSTVDFLFEGKSNPAFAERIIAYISRISEYVPSLLQMDLTIESENTFPHSSGIASSASAMSALALCLTDLESKISGKEFSLQEISSLARLGSGSACRSLYPEVALWGEYSPVAESSNLYAIDMSHDIDPVFRTYRDSILIVSHDKKSVSSSAGHQLMETNPYRDTRYHEAGAVMNHILQALRQGDLPSFIKWTEWEALDLHALMMVSDPSFILMKPETLSIIQEIRNFREESGLPICFTLDAGPNVHLLYPESCAEETLDFVNRSLLQYCQTKTVLHDKVGLGPKKIK